MEKTIIEDASTELLELFDQITEEAKIEKLGNAKPPINQILYWWTRKPLIVARAVALASTLQNVNDMKGLLRLDPEKRAHTVDPSKEIYAMKLNRDPSTIKVLDPFAGAGNLIYEAKRLGLKCFSMDYNPVAYLIQKAVLDYPAIYGEKLANDVEKYGTQIIENTHNEVGNLYESQERNTLAYLWAWCIKCPYCNQRFPLLNHMWFARRKKRRVGVSIKTTKDLNFTIEIENKIKDNDANKFTQKGGKAICIRCRNTVSYEQMSNDIKERKDRELIGIVVNRGGKSYEAPSDDDRKKLRRAKEILQENWSELLESNLVPIEEIKPGHRREHLLWHYGIKNWYEFYNERQLIVLTSLLRNIRKVCTELAATDKDYSIALATYLSFLLCKHANYNCLGIYWHALNEQIGSALAFRSPRLLYNFAETNSFGGGSGSLKSMLSDIIGAIRYASKNNSKSLVTRSSVLNIPYPDKSFDLIITDPPYLDDVQYGELSEFFYTWISRSMNAIPDLPLKVPLDEDICVSWGRYGDKKMAEAFYEKAMKQSFKQISRVLKDDGLLVVFFAHSSTEAWNLLLEILRESRLMVGSSYALHTENTGNPLARGKTSFMSSVVVVCRKLTQDSVAYFEDIIPVAEDKIKEMLAKISPEKLLLIPLTDLLIMVYGKVLEATTNHTELRSYEKDFKADFESLISNSRDFILRMIVTKLTGRSINLLGSQMSFYLLTKIFYRGILAGDDLLKVTRTYGLSKEQIEKDKLGKNEDGCVRLYYLHEHKLERKPEDIDAKNTHQQLCYLVQIADTVGSSKLIPILSHPNFRIDDLKQIVSLLLKSFRLRINKKEQLIQEEQKELKILETLADTMGIKSEGSLDSFMRYQP